MEEIAAKHYLVERIESDLLSRTRMMVWQATHAPRGGRAFMVPPIPDPSRPLVLPEADIAEIQRNARGDMVRISDREGNVVWWREFRSREAGLAKYAEIMDDLMKVAPGEFRRKYGIIPERPPEVEAARPAQPDGPKPGSASDPNGPWADVIRRSEGGTEWTAPDEGPGAHREGDVGWGDFGQR